MSCSSSSEAPPNPDLYKWDDSPGLAHHCGVCSTPLANPRALQTCIGRHVEPCQRYHQQLHFIKKSHECMSCHNSVQMHLKRYRSVLTSSRGIKEHGSDIAVHLATPNERKGKSHAEDQGDVERSNSSGILSEAEIAEHTAVVVTPSKSSKYAGIDQDGNLIPLSHKEIRRIRKLNAKPSTATSAKVLTADGAIQDIISQVDNLKVTNSVASCPLTTAPSVTSSVAPSLLTEKPSEETTAMETPTQTPTPTTKKEKKQARKLAANSKRVLDAEIFTEADYAFVSEALYQKPTWGKGASLRDNQDHGRDSKRTSPSTDDKVEDDRCISKMGSHNQRTQNATRKDPPGARSTTSDLLQGIDPQIFHRLGINLDGVETWDKNRKDHLKKLVSAISSDLMTTEREDQETEMRAAGFLRFVNKGTITTLTELHERFSWSTGEIKKQNKSQMKEMRSKEDHPAAPRISDALSLSAKTSPPSDWTIEMVRDETSRLYQKISREFPMIRGQAGQTLIPNDLARFRKVLEETKQEHSALMLKRVAEESACDYEITFVNEKGEREHVSWTWPGCMPEIVEKSIKVWQAERNRLRLETAEREKCHSEGRPYIKQHRILRIVNMTEEEKNKQDEVKKKQEEDLQRGLQYHREKIDWENYQAGLLFGAEFTERLSEEDPATFRSRWQ